MRMIRYCLILLVFVASLGAVAAGCSDADVCADDPNNAECVIPLGGACEPGVSVCAEGLSCAETLDGYACFAPVYVVGQVFDAQSLAAIEGAHVLAFDDQNTAITDVAVTGLDGRYRLQVPLLRNADGTPVNTELTLRASAQDYQTFPGGLRTALPISTSEAAKGDSSYTIDTPLTDIALILLPATEQGLGSVSGSVEGANPAGVLVVADGDSTHTAITDAGGDYTIFNVSPGSYEVRGYAADLQLNPRSIDMTTADLTGVDLTLATEALSSVSGSIQIVNAPGSAKTSVVLVVAGTFSDTFVRGEVPRGLRSPLSGPPSVDGAFTIDNVPMGEYVVLAAFENDGLVRDPDPNISGTQIVTVSVGAGETITLDDSFKVTEALAVIGPGADGPEAVSATPTFQWEDDSSEDFYSVVVYDAFGELIWEEPMVPSVSGADVSVVYAGPALESGLYYQFRATSWKQSGNQEPGPISTTEDLRGVFFVP